MIVDALRKGYFTNIRLNDAFNLVGIIPHKNGAGTRITTIVQWLHGLM